MSETKSNKQNSNPSKARTRKIPKRITETYLHNSGLYYLERYSASSAHFRTVMLRKVRRSCMHHEDQSFDDCAPLVDKLVEKFVNSGLLNDDQYLQGMVSSYRKKGLSSRMIMQKLQMKGLKPDQIQDYINKYDEQNDDENSETLAAAIFCRRKKLGAFRLKALVEGGHEKEISKLARAGFQYQTIKNILDMNLDDLENLIYG